VAQMSLKFVLRWYICQERIFSVLFFNGRVKSFIYGYPERRNKPTANFNVQSLNNVADHKIKQKALQTWCLLRVFPFLVADQVAEDDPHLYLILLLLRIMEIVMAPKIAPGLVVYLQELITEHHIAFRNLFPEIHLINKHHHLDHYADSIMESGPMGLYWCMRYEGKHQAMKRHAANCCNFINTPVTLARVHQLSQCAVWGTKNDWEDKIQCTQGMTVSVSSCLDNAHLVALGYEMDAQVFRSPSAIVNGIEFRKGLFVMKDDGHGTDRNLPFFGLIKELIIINNSNDLLITIEEWKTVHLRSKLNAYYIKRRLDKHIVTISNNSLPYPIPIATWTEYETAKKYLSLRHLV
jgi:hypothetical protein